MKTMLTALATLLPASLLLSACNTVTPNYDTRFGDAVREAKLRMTIDPDAQHVDPVAGMDGRAARATAVLYQKTFTTPPPVVNVINIGGAVGGGK